MFTDASELAYATAVYVRVSNADGTATMTLAIAKARPAPIKRRTIPLLELQGAVLGSRLGEFVRKTLGIATSDVYYWTDWMNVLYWVRSPSRRFKIEVGNRVSEIQQLTMTGNWHHVPGKLNPADFPTRELTAEQLVDESRWWEGAPFLREPPSQWPQRQIIVPQVLPSQLKRADVTLAATPAVTTDNRLHPEHYSSWTRLVRVTAWCHRFVSRARRTTESDALLTEAKVPVATAESRTVLVPELSAEELRGAERHWIRVSQREVYPVVVATLEKGNELPPSAPLLKLRPFLDDENGDRLLRVGGRLRTAHHLSSEFRSPVILPPRHRVTELIIQHEDRRCRHSVGTNHLLANLADRYWLIKGKQMVKMHRHSCVGCQKVWRKPVVPPMGQLPDYRTQGTLPAFARTPVDYAGPFYVKRGRGKSQEKRYVAVFTCLQSRACHFEMVTSLDTEGFKMALTRFCCRRGTPQFILTDNGGNFVATERELREAVSQINHATLTADLAGQGVEWRFNPPRAPHFGGVFERMVRAMKQVLQTVLYKADLTEEELLTALVQAEALVNSRPLTVVSDDIDDPEPLTPAHFLIGHASMTTPLEHVESDSRINPRHWWKVLQNLMQQIWKRWMREVVARANLASKWFKDAVDLDVGTVLIVADSSLPRARWSLGRVVATYPGRDGRVRVVDIKVSGKVYKRSVHQLVPLDVAPTG